MIPLPQTDESWSEPIQMAAFQIIWPQSSPCKAELNKHPTHSAGRRGRRGCQPVRST